MRTLAILLLAALPAEARSLCGVTDEAEVLAAISGIWQAEERISLENAATSLIRVPAPARAEIGPGGIETDFLDGLTGAPLPLRRTDPPPYGVDAIDDLLETTGHAELADRLSDTPCGPEELPQLVARLPAGTAPDATGTVTLLAYFDDRLLQITEMVLRSEETVLFLTGTALLTPAR